MVNNTGPFKTDQLLKFTINIGQDSRLNARMTARPTVALMQNQTVSVMDDKICCRGSFLASNT